MVMRVSMLCYVYMYTAYPVVPACRSHSAENVGQPGIEITQFSNSSVCLLFVLQG